MEKAIFKTLAYSDIFDYPLKPYEVHKWLIGRKTNLRTVEKSLSLLRKKRRINQKGDFYFMGRKEKLVDQRKKKAKQSLIYLRKAKVLAKLLKIIPWVKLVGISGGLAMDNAKKADDIDFFIIAAKGRLWTCRLMALGLLTLTGQRRQVADVGRKIAGKICLNTILEEDKLEQANKDLYTAHEVLQMKVLWEREGIYQKYLEDNLWVFKYIPNWVSSPTTALRGAKRRSNLLNNEIATPFGLAMTTEKMAKWFQLRIMNKPQGMERIQPGALYFHPRDCRLEVLSKFKKRISRFKIGTPS